MEKSVKWKNWLNRKSVKWKKVKQKNQLNRKIG